MKFIFTSLVFVVAAFLSPIVQGWLTGGSGSYSELTNVSELRGSLSDPFSLSEGKLTLTIGSVPGGLAMRLSSSQDPLLAFVDVGSDSDSIDMFWGIAPTLREKVASLGKSNEAQGLTSLLRVTGTLPPLPQLADSLNIEIGISPGVLAKWFEQPFALSAAAAGVSPDDETIKNLSSVAASYTAERFDYQDIQERTEWLRLVGGPVQLVTIFVTLSSIALAVGGLFIRGLFSIAETVVELIPFTGFFGTLLGMQDALNIFGIADISDDASKALNLGQIGGKLGLAVTTTIFAIICFGMVIMLFAVVQTVLREKATGTAG